MKTRLIKRLRKQVKDNYRLIPTTGRYGWVIERKYDLCDDLYEPYGYFDIDKLDVAIKVLEECRDLDYRVLAEHLIANRKYERERKRQSKKSEDFVITSKYGEDIITRGDGKDIITKTHIKEYDKYLTSLN